MYGGVLGIVILTTPGRLISLLPVANETLDIHNTSERILALSTGSHC